MGGGASSMFTFASVILVAFNLKKATNKPYLQSQKGNKQTLKPYLYVHWKPYTITRASAGIQQIACSGPLLALEESYHEIVKQLKA